MKLTDVESRLSEAGFVFEERGEIRASPFGPNRWTDWSLSWVTDDRVVWVSIESIERPDRSVVQGVKVWDTAVDTRNPILQASYADDVIESAIKTAINEGV